MMATTTVEDNTALSKQYETPLGLAHDTMQALKDRIKTHYDLASEYYLSLWYVTMWDARVVTVWSLHLLMVRKGPISAATALCFGQPSTMAPRLLTMSSTTQGHPHPSRLLADARVKGQ